MAKTIETIAGNRCITETISYPSTGRVVKRLFNSIADVVPEDIIVISQGSVGKTAVEAMKPGMLRQKGVAHS